MRYVLYVWENGAYLFGSDPSFGRLLEGLINQYGYPSEVKLAE